LGDADSREAWRNALVGYFRDVRGELSEDSQKRLEKNPLRILDSKDRRDQAFVAGAPQIDDFLSAEAQDFFAAVISGLDAAGVEWTRNSALVRGLDYYRHTAFEFVTDRLGAQGTVLGGGRYDGLMESLGGPATPAVGWAAGIERLAMLVGVRKPEPLSAAIIPMSEEALPQANAIARKLRQRASSVEIFATGKVKKRMARANDANALLAIIIGEDELNSGEITVKDLASGEQIRMQPDDIVDTVSQAESARFIREIETSGYPEYPASTDNL
jgi:histidyl-tRNA synthetase